MGKKRIVKKGGEAAPTASSRSQTKSPRRLLDRGVLHVLATYNNTRVTLTDDAGNAIASSSSGSLGFKGAKKSTPFAAAKVGELIGDKGKELGIKEVSVILTGVGSGRESAIRAFMSRGAVIRSISDETPIPHNGPRPKKSRRV